MRSRPRWIGSAGRTLLAEEIYWLVDDNWGRLSQQLEFQNLELFKPHIIKALQDLLVDYPDWYITIRIAVPEKEGIWPGMGLIIYSDEVVDELRRDFFARGISRCRFRYDQQRYRSRAGGAGEKAHEKISKPRRHVAFEPRSGCVQTDLTFEHDRKFAGAIFPRSSDRAQLSRRCPQSNFDV
jgi:hypothetical protein